MAPQDLPRNVANGIGPLVPRIIIRNRPAWFLTELTPQQQDAYVERLFDDESRTVPPVSGRPTWWFCPRRGPCHLGGDGVEGCRCGGR